MRDFKKCDITYLLRKIDLEMLPHLKIASGSFIYYVINVYVPRVRANAYHMLTTPPRVFRDPKMCLRNIWTAPKCSKCDKILSASRTDFHKCVPGRMVV